LPQKVSRCKAVHEWHLTMQTEIPHDRLRSQGCHLVHGESDQINLMRKDETRLQRH
ncbi:hypothetical protein WOLCODRAFT_135694, partial [Wolfiporia cocos MD-104 SS10]